MAQTWPTAADIINAVAVRLGLTATRAEDAEDPYDSEEVHYVQLCQLLEDVGDELVRAHDWSQLQEDQVFDSDPIVTSGAYDLPDDFDRFVNDTFWNQDTNEPLLGPLSQQKWQEVQAQDLTLVRQAFRIWKAKVYIHPAPSSVQRFAYEYIRSYWAEAAEDDLGRPTKAAPTAGDDVLYFDERLLKTGLELAWREAKGMDTTAALQRYQLALSDATAADSAAPVLCVTPSSDEVRAIDERNTPETGYGE